MFWTRLFYIHIWNQQSSKYGCSERLWSFFFLFLIMSSAVVRLAHYGNDLQCNSNSLLWMYIKNEIWDPAPIHGDKFMFLNTTNTSSSKWEHTKHIKLDYSVFPSTGSSLLYSYYLKWYEYRLRNTSFPTIYLPLLTSSSPIQSFHRYKKNTCSASVNLCTCSCSLNPPGGIWVKHNVENLFRCSGISLHWPNHTD